MTALAEAVHAYLQGFEARSHELTKPDRDMLDRLAKSVEAARAFDALASPADADVWLINDCVQAARLASGLHRAQVAETIDESKRNTAAAKAVRRARDVIATYLYPAGFGEEIRALDAALAFRQGFDERHDSFFRTVISRKRDKAAARQRAIGLIKESIRRLTGKANLKLVLSLSEVALDAEDELYLDHVKKAPTLPDRIEKAFPCLRRQDSRAKKSR